MTFCVSWANMPDMILYYFLVKTFVATCYSKFYFTNFLQWHLHIKPLRYIQMVNWWTMWQKFACFKHNCATFASVQCKHVQYSNQYFVSRVCWRGFNQLMRSLEDFAAVITVLIAFCVIDYVLLSEQDVKTQNKSHWPGWNVTSPMGDVHVIIPQRHPFQVSE